MAPARWAERVTVVATAYSALYSRAMTTTSTTTATTKLPFPANGKCPRCAAPVATVWTEGEANRANYQVRSACCGRWTIVQRIDGRVGKRECGDHCTEGTGRKCTCTCGGAQHGLAYRVMP
jgi:hypothetical protein